MDPSGYDGNLALVELTYRTTDARITTCFLMLERFDDGGWKVIWSGLSEGVIVS